jgi:hypothetical protein
MNAKITQKLHIGIYAILVFVMLFLILIIYWLVYPYKPIEMKSPVKVLNSPVKAGEAVHFELEFCKYMDIEAETTKVLVNDYIIPYPTTSGKGKLGCQKMISSSHTVPDYVSAGTYKIMLTTTYKVNPIRTVQVDYETEEFEVI